VDPYRIVLADDHAMIRQGLRKLIEDVDGLSVVGEAGDGEELREVLGNTPADMVILDISMPKLSGLEVLQEIRETYPSLQVLVVTMHKEYLRRALALGVHGYLLKEDADRVLFFAIDNLREGKRFLSPRLTDEAVADLNTPFEPLTAREREVIRLIAEGKANKEIAEALFVSVRTVESHRASIIRKLSLKSTADLVKYAMQKGYI
jgi:DNA-binding NarL/FixJ family response regulator